MNGHIKSSAMQAEWAAERSKLSDAELAAGEARDRLMALPAPDLKALKWKLRTLLAPDEEGGFTASWSAAYVLPVLADLDRLVPPSMPSM